MMDIALSVTLGILFLLCGVAAFFLMMHLWGYPYDKATRTSAAPPGLMRLHRILGWVYVLIYLVMMYEMVPRLWLYQVELPARTVVHLMLGMTIGVILLIKLSIIRFFRHLEEWMPALGVGLLLCTVLLSGLSIPFALREFALASSAVGGGVYSLENRERVARLLPLAGLPEEAPVVELASLDALREGRNVLVRKCVECHDLKTILIRPRSPADWWKTVERMAVKPTFGAAMTERELWTVSAYLVAITRDIQRSVKVRKQAAAEHLETRDALRGLVAAEGATAGAEAVDPARAQEAFETLCTQCHELSDVEAEQPSTSDGIDQLFQRMIDENGMEATEEELRLVKWYMEERFVSPSA
jgi:cytochrome c5